MLPQLDFSHYSSQVFWLIVCFGILITAMKKVFIPKMNVIIKKREEMIAHNAEKLLTLETERNLLADKVNESEKQIAKTSANILKAVDEKYIQILSEQLTNLKHEHEKVMNQLITKYENDIKMLERTEPEKIEMLIKTVFPKFTGTRIDL